jgi:asparagine synthase (glutamine-hydrolysing)
MRTGGHAVRGHLGGEWDRYGDTRATGHAFLDGASLPAEDLAAAVNAAADPESVLQRANGFFAVVIERGGAVHLFTDRIASHPLFYGRTDGSAYYSDDASWVREQVGDDSYDPLSELEYLLSGYVTGPNTLSPRVNQVLCGEHLVVSDSAAVDRGRWFEFPTPGRSDTRSETDLLDALDDVLVAVYERLIEYADGRRIVVSLSAGHDSRLNLLMLTRLGYDNVTALSYAEKDAETDLVKRIADDVGVSWVYLPETHDAWHEWYNSDERERYEAESGYLHRIPAIGAALGVRTASERELVPTDSIFVTGDGVMSTGEHIPSSVVGYGTTSRATLLKQIARSHYKQWEYGADVEAVLTDRVAASVDSSRSAPPVDLVELAERWDWQERQSKFIPRNHVFEFWGFDWWMPLWDAEYLRFWDGLPDELKFDKRLHRRYVDTLYRDVTGASRGRLAASTWTGASVGQRLKHRLRHTPLDPTGSRLDTLARKVYFTYVDRREYAERPIYGIMEREQYEQLQTGLLSIHGFQALEVLDRVSFDPPENSEVPSSMPEVIRDR